LMPSLIEIAKWTLNPMSSRESSFLRRLSVKLGFGWNCQSIEKW
jgi:hypothetical protein